MPTASPLRWRALAIIALAQSMIAILGALVGITLLRRPHPTEVPAEPVPTLAA